MYATISSVRFYSHLFCRGFMFYFYVNWCPSRFPFQMMFVSFNSYTTGITSGAGTANPSGNLSSSRISVGFVLLVLYFLCSVL